MPRVTTPVGSTASAAAGRRAARSHRYREQRETREGFREVAWLLIKYRMDHGLTQEELAKRVGTSYSQISRIESGRHRASLQTLERIAHALDLKLLIGFEQNRTSERQLVAL
jgi:ribosome-binding protein aMBF1 (putative translation factor)